MGNTLEIKQAKLLDAIGGTPLIELKKMAAQTSVRVFAKAEFMNPSGSVKDRAARAMLLDGLASGELASGKTIIDATSGNTGIAYAMLGAALGFPVKLYMPSNTSEERKQMIHIFGAQIIETSSLEGTDGAYLAANEAATAEPHLYFYPDQYNNRANPDAHYNGTGVEIWEQTGGEITHFISGMGTSGTFMGVSKRLKEKNPSIKTWAVQPSSPFHGIEGTKHMASTLKPGILDERLEDGVIYVETEEAYETTRRLARKEGLFVGVSSGGNVAAALKLASGLRGDALVVTVLCDAGVRYLSDRFWDGK